jgi:hypothetical protein
VLVVKGTFKEKFTVAKFQLQNSKIIFNNNLVWTMIS